MPAIDEETVAGATAQEGRGAAVAVVYYTDPLCSWSWAFEPQWRRLRFEVGDRLAWRYRMGGMIPDWARYSDPVNAVSRPLQMAPQWFHVRHLTGMPIDERIWFEDPPDSSYPACIAVKAAERQSPQAAERYLRHLREAVMLDRRNIARRAVILAVADELAADDLSRGAPERFDADRFRRDLDDAASLDAFRADLKEARYLGIGRFPALTLHREGAPGIGIIGYRPYGVLRAALARIAPDLAPSRRARSRAEYEAYWGRLTERELAEALDMPR